MCVWNDIAYNGLSISNALMLFTIWFNVYSNTKTSGTTVTTSSGTPTSETVTNEDGSQTTTETTPITTTTTTTSVTQTQIGNYHVVE